MHQSHSILNLRRFLSTSAVYAAGDLLTKCARVILIPYYIHALTTSELGTLGVLQAVAAACWYLSALGLGYGIRRFYFDYGPRGDQFVATVWWARMAITAVPCAALIAISYTASPWIMPQISRHLVALAIAGGFLRGGFTIVESWFVIRERPFQYRAFTFFQFLTTTALIIYLVSVQRMGVTGAIVGEVAAHAVWTGMSAAAFGKSLVPLLQSFPWRTLTRYCAPVLPYTMFMWALAWCDRLFLQRYVPLSELGIYDAGYMLASAISMLALAMRATWLPDFFRHAQSAAARAEYARVATYFFAVMAFASGVTIAFAPEAIWLVARNGFEDAIPIVRIVVIGLAFHSMFVAFYQPLMYVGRTMAVAVISGTALLINIACNLALIPSLGITGAALATVTAYVVLAAAAFVVTQREYHIPWEYGRFAGCATGAVLVGVCGCLFPDRPSWEGVAAKCLAVLTYAGWLGYVVQPGRRKSCAVPSQTNEPPAAVGVAEVVRGGGP